jgi:hypothetical protein
MIGADIITPISAFPLRGYGRAGDITIPPYDLSDRPTVKGIVLVDTTCGGAPAAL